MLSRQREAEKFRRSASTYCRCEHVQTVFARCVEPAEHAEVAVRMGPHFAEE